MSWEQQWAVGMLVALIVWALVGAWWVARGEGEVE